MKYKIRAKKGILKLAAIEGPPHSFTHDLLEHVNGLYDVDMSIRDRLMALGGCWFVRGHEEYARVYQLILEELVILCVSVNMDLEEVEHQKCREARTLGLMINEASIRANKTLITPTKAEQVNFWRQASRYMIWGFNKAQSRYRNRRSQAYDLFYDVQELLEKHQADDEIELEISFKRLEAKVL